ncbi:hypothetical protein ASG72_08710 [Bosea sp. Leaf344]|uniref:YgaP family membrane protein n=1 Tax=Bosea sp. Leaf344 TaxID=1736346 RepID=UPI0006F8EDE0|nr:DUF2892 domain-containing protein [Bosea sp. Leaf344]KQU51607.1 hypothetical protein ASG72_08710 [Bosea sp. Leaf344]
MANLGSVDRTIRFVAGLLLFVAPFLPWTAGLFTNFGAFVYALPVVGLVLIATAIFRFCPAYALFGIRTCEIGR